MTDASPSPAAPRPGPPAMPPIAPPVVPVAVAPVAPVAPVAVVALAAAAAVAGLLQLIAGIALGLAAPDALHRAVREGPRVYIILVLALAGSGLLAIVLRARWRLALGLGLLGPVIAGLLVWRGNVSRLGLAYHGEFVLHHFLSLVCAALSLAITLQWRRDPRLGRWRAWPAVPAGLGVALLLTQHLLAIGSERTAGATIGPLGQIGMALALLTWPIALAALWSTIAPPRLRLWLLATAVPVAVRLAIGGAATLAGVPLGLAAAAPLMTAAILASVACMVLLRPQLDPVLRLLVTLGAGVMTLGLYRVYLLRFGDLEGDLGGLVRSLFGFDLPYPGYVPDWQLTAAMFGLFVLLATVGGALISARDHARGLGLALMVTAGLGLTSPQLALMLTAGYLVLLDATAPSPPDPRARYLPPPVAIDHTLRELAVRLGLPAPVQLDQARGRVLSIRGELDHAGLQLRAREAKRGWSVELTLGVPGRGRPELELIPDDRVHRLLGNPRRLESLPEALLLALTDHPTHRTRLWPGGVHIDFGRDLSGLDPDRLHHLLIQLGRAL